MKRNIDAAYTFPRKKQQKAAPSLRVQPTFAIDHPILKLYYPNVCYLGKVLQDWLPPTSRSRRKRLDRWDNDFPQHAGFLENTLVCYGEQQSLDIQSARQNELVAFTQTQRVVHHDSHEQSTCNLAEILDFTVWSLFQKNTSTLKNPTHLLCHGYQKCSLLRIDDDRIGPSRLPGIVHKTLNANVESLRKSPWQDIANLLGKDSEVIMLNLFLDCGIYQQLNSGRHNLYQLSGEPISHMRTLAITNVAKPSSRGQGQPPKTETRPGSITFVRNRMYHARPSLNGQGNVQLGFKHIHILNRCKDVEDHAQDIRVLQYVFPRQFGLHNVFTSKPNPTETVQPLKDYTMREHEILSSDRRRMSTIPPRLRGSVMTLISKLRRNHSRCSYTQLLRHHCPVAPPCVLPSETAHAYEPASSTEAGQLVTQPGLHGTNSSCEAQPAPRSTASLMPYATPTLQVVAFCQAVMLRLLPQDTFGSGDDGHRNWRAILHSVEQFIKMHRFESITLHEICQRIRILCIDWLRPSKVKKGDHLSASDKAKRIALLQELLYYVFDSILVPLVTSNFYVTETGVHRNRLFYFRHDVWKKLADPSLAMMKLTMFEPLHPRQLKHSFASNSLGCSQMRLLPKEHGARPIMNLRRKAMKIVNGKPVLGRGINAQLTQVFSVLNLERERQPELLASAMFSVGEIHSKLKAFKAGLRSCQTPFYFAKVDIRSCFDTIPQRDLLHFIDTLLLNNEYQVATHVEMKQIPTSGRLTSPRVVPRYVWRALQPDINPLLSSDVADRLASKKMRHIFVGTNQERVLRLGQVRKMLTDHLQHNIVRVGRKHFRQVEGIPQGSVLSSLLCSLYYGDFERQQLSFLDSSTSLVLRLIDDFLLITTDESQARRFVQAMSDGNVKHGITVNAEKSLVNFEVSIRGHKIPRLHGAGSFPYCGIMIDTRDLQLRKDRQPRDLYVANGLSVARSGRVGVAFQGKVISSLKRQLHTMLLDGTLNKRERILKSIFECFVETGMKMHQYLKLLPKHKRPTAPCLMKLCKQLVEMSITTLRRIQHLDPVLLTKAQLRWLATAALSTVLARKPSEYSSLLGWLQQAESQARKSMNMTSWQLQRLKKEGIEQFVAHVY